MKIPVSVAVVLVAAGLQSVRPTAQSAPAFEVVSVKRNLTGGPVTAFPEPGGLIIRNFNALDLVEFAFELPHYLVTGGPPWAATDRFDISAKTGGTATNRQMRTMLRSALAQRFQLATRVESREQPRYALVLDREDRRLGAGLRAATSACVPLVFPNDGPPPPPPPPGAPAAECPSVFGPGFMSIRLEEMPTIAQYLGTGTTDGRLNQLPTTNRQRPGSPNSQGPTKLASRG